MGEVKPARLLIIGSGPAGYTAAIYGARAMLAPVLVEGLEPGGQLTITTEVENWPGDTSVLGPDLMARMRAHAEAVGTEIVSDLIQSVDFSRRPFVAIADGGTEFQADAVVIATGAKARWLGLANETRLRGRGVSACATCDGFFFRDRHVAVVGGGNTAAEEALFLSNFASRVTLVHRRAELRADKVNQQRLFANSKIEFLWDTIVTDVHGDDSVTGIELADANTGAKRDFAVDGLFLAIGHDPATAMFQGQLEIDADGYVVVEPGTPRTSVDGVFAAGDVVDRHYRQAVTAAGMGCMAALEAEHFLARTAG